MSWNPEQGYPVANLAVSFSLFVRMQERSDPSLAEAFQKCLNVYYASNTGSQSQGSGIPQGNLESALQEALVLFHAVPDFRGLLSTTNEYNQTLAHLSILSGYTTLLNSLVDWGIDLTIADVNGFTALHCAYLMGGEDSVELLRNKGAPEGSVDNMGRVPQDLYKFYHNGVQLNNAGGTSSTIDIPTMTRNEGEAFVTNVQSEILQCPTTLISLPPEPHNIIGSVYPDKIISPASCRAPSLFGLCLELHMFIAEVIHADYVASERGHTPHPLLSLRR